MGLDYINANTGIFSRLGPIIARVNAYAAIATGTFVFDVEAILTPYENAQMMGQVEGIVSAYSGFQDQITSIRQSVAGYADNTLTDRSTILIPLGVLSADTSQVLPALYQQMLTDGKTVNRSTVTIGAVSGPATNNGNGTVLVTKVLDGYNAPIQGALANLNYNGVASELAVPVEAMTLVCTLDSSRDKAQEGSEQFSWSGWIANPAFDWHEEGSGQGPSLTVANGSTIVTDGSFENWSNTNTPTNWTITAGTAGVNVFQDNVAANVYRGLASLKLTGDGVTSGIGVSQAVSTASLQSRRMYNVSFRAKASAASAGFQASFTGTGYTASSTEKVTVAAGSAPTAWTLYNFFISLPSVLPSNWTLTLNAVGVLPNGVSVWIDSLACKEVVYHGGLGAVVVAGSKPWVDGDELQFQVTNDGKGVFQTFMRQKYQFQLPSATSPTISDTLAAMPAGLQLDFSLAGNSTGIPLVF